MNFCRQIYPSGLEMISNWFSSRQLGVKSFDRLQRRQRRHREKHLQCQQRDHQVRIFELKSPLLPIANWCFKWYCTMNCSTDLMKQYWTKGGSGLTQRGSPVGSASLKDPGSWCNSIEKGSNPELTYELGKILALPSGHSDISARFRNVAKNRRQLRAWCHHATK